MQKRANFMLRVMQRAGPPRFGPLLANRGKDFDRRKYGRGTVEVPG